MAGTSTKRPPAPSPIERAKTIAMRSGPATLVPSVRRGEDAEERVIPPLHHVHPSGSVSLLLPDGHQLISAAAQSDRGELSVMCELADRAPVQLREPIRGLLWISGTLRALDERSARARAVAIADVRPDPALLDLGHGWTMMRLVPSSLVLADGEGTHSLQPHMFSAATPDPFHGYEAQWLQHLESDHPEVVEDMARHLPEELRSGRIRPLGVDRFGLRLRVEAEAGDHDIRLAFSRTVDSPQDLGVEMRRLVGCPFLAALEHE